MYFGCGFAAATGDVSWDVELSVGCVEGADAVEAYNRREDNGIVEIEGCCLLLHEKHTYVSKVDG